MKKVRAGKNFVYDFNIGDLIYLDNLNKLGIGDHFIGKITKKSKNEYRVIYNC
jgi:hypothetical protein